MKTQARYIGMVIVVLVAVFAGVNTTWAATNQATDPGSGSVTLASSGTVTITSSALQLVKEVWSAVTPTTCFAGTSIDASCTVGTANVASGTLLKFVIFVKNSTAFALDDVRIQDVLDISGTGFTYQTGTLKYDVSQTDAATSAQIFTALQSGTAVAQTDAITDDYASYVAGTVYVGQPTNVKLTVAANKTFALQFQAKKN